MKNKQDYSKWLFLGIGILIGVIITMMAQPSAKEVSLTGAEWESAFHGEGNKLIYIGRPTCSWCSKFQPGLDNLSEQYNFEYVYVNIDEISDSEFDTILTTLGIDSSEFGTPYLAVVKDGNKLDEQPGYVAEEPLFNFLQANGFIAEDTVYAPNENTPAAE